MLVFTMSDCLIKNFRSINVDIIITAFLLYVLRLDEIQYLLEFYPDNFQISSINGHSMSDC